MSIRITKISQVLFLSTGLIFLSQKISADPEEEFKFVSSRFQDMCQLPNSLAYEECYNFVAGIEQMRLAEEDQNQKHLYCPPEKIFIDDEISIWMSFLENHPSMLRYPAIVTYINSMNLTFPCQKEIKLK